MSRGSKISVVLLLGFAIASGIGHVAPHRAMITIRLHRRVQENRHGVNGDDLGFFGDARLNMHVIMAPSRPAIAPTLDNVRVYA